MSNKKSNINFRKSPYKGIFKKIAKKLSDEGHFITSDGVRKAYYRNDPDIILLVTEEIEILHQKLQEALNAKKRIEESIENYE